jgi:hypothetical protein
LQAQAVVTPRYFPGNGKGLGDEFLSGDFDAPARPNGGKIVSPAMCLSAFELEFAPQYGVCLLDGQPQKAFGRGSLPTNRDRLDQVPPRGVAPFGDRARNLVQRFDDGPQLAQQREEGFRGSRTLPAEPVPVTDKNSIEPRQLKEGLQIDISHNAIL